MGQCSHSLYLNYDGDRVGCLRGCGYSASVREAMLIHCPSVRVEPVTLESSGETKKTGLMIATQEGYMGVLSGCVGGVLCIEKITASLEIRRSFYDLLYSSLGVFRVHDGTGVVYLRKTN